MLKTGFFSRNVSKNRRCAWLVCTFKGLVGVHKKCIQTIFYKINQKYLDSAASTLYAQTVTTYGRIVESSRRL